MFEALTWLLLGALVGYAAAEKKGFSKVAGMLGGAVLGPILAILLFAVSGVTSGVKPVQCRHCGQWINGAAATCPACHKSTAPEPTTRPCPACAEQIQLDAKKCRHCGEWLDGRATA